MPPHRRKWPSGLPCEAIKTGRFRFFLGRVEAKNCGVEVRLSQHQGLWWLGAKRWELFPSQSDGMGVDEISPDA